MAFGDYKHLVISTAAAHGYDAPLLAAQAGQESGWNPLAQSPVGALGLMQFMPGTWGDWGGQGKVRTDPAASLDAGVRYMQHLLKACAEYASPTETALAAYNWGLSRVQSLVRQQKRSDWAYLAPLVPTETRNYVAKISAKRAWYAVQLGGAVLPAMGAAVVALALLAFFMMRR